MLTSLRTASLAMALILASCSGDSGADGDTRTSTDADASVGSATDTGETDGDSVSDGTDGESSGDTSGDALLGGEPDQDGDDAGGDSSDAEGDTSDLDAGVVGGDASLSLVPTAGQAIPDHVTVEETDAGELLILCGTEECQCADGIDNDGDGNVDGQDGECTGPFDDDESTFSTGIPGDNRDNMWQDCFFDGNSGAGDDGCRYHSDCLDPDAETTERDMCEVSQECKDYCQPLVPPGCDCFGCCEIPNAGETVHVLVAETCSIDVLDDEQKCPRCVPTTACENECGECELCIGKTLEDLPESCFPPSDDDDPPSGGGAGSSDPPGSGGAGGADPGNPDAGAGGGVPPDDEMPPVNVCDNGAPACVESADCPSQNVCSFGCCMFLPEPK
jgi:hypothetical protein